MTKAKRILIVGDGSSVFMARLLDSLSRNNNAQIICDFYDRTAGAPETVSLCGAENVYCTRIPKLLCLLLKIPKVRLAVRMLCEWHTISTLLNKQHYDLLNIHQLPFYVVLFVRTAHRHRTKTLLTPIGSDALRLSSRLASFLRKAFEETDYISMNMQTGFSRKVIDKYKIDEIKMVNLSYGSDSLSAICRMKGKYERQALADMIGVPLADYYICCGYNAHRAQRHAVMLGALAENRQLLPKNYRVIIPLGYGDNGALKSELEGLVKSLCLDVIFLMDFLSPEKVAALRLLTDLFIHIQTTDAHCFTMHEFLLAGSQVVNGSWLSYPELEMFGKPYHTCETPEDLPMTIKKLFCRELKPKTISPELKNRLRGDTWDKKTVEWMNFYLSV